MSEELTINPDDLQRGDVFVCWEPEDLPGQGRRVSIIRGADVLTAKPGDGYTQQQLSDAFDLVKNPDGWKLPVRKTLTARQVADVTESLLSEAVIYFTGSLPEIFPDPVNPGYVRVEASGYYACIGS